MVERKGATSLPPGTLAAACFTLAESPGLGVPGWEGAPLRASLSFLRRHGSRFLLHKTPTDSKSGFKLLRLLQPVMT